MFELLNSIAGRSELERRRFIGNIPGDQIAHGTFLTVIIFRNDPSFCNLTLKAFWALVSLSA